MVAPLKNGGIRSGGGGRPYGFMLLLAVGAACLGFMVLHKLREGRVLSLLVQEKDHELLSLHYLLQRERELSKETRKKLEETKTSLFSLKAQKMDAEGKLVEVESLISSLKDEQKIIESQLEEKRDEINTLKRQQMMQREASELTATDENDAVQPKSRSEKSATKVWSVSSDDPSAPPMNVTAAVDGETRQPRGLGNDSAEKPVKHRKRKWRNLIRRLGKDEQAKQDEAVAPKEQVAADAGAGSKLNETAKLVQDSGVLKAEDRAAVGNTGMDDKVQESGSVDARENRMVKKDE